MNAISIDLDSCNGCRICHKACFADVFRWDEDRKRPVVAYPEDCAQCNLCELYCPKQCLQVTVGWDKSFPPVIERGFPYPV
jgi:NAD-dependent dihydropyrimidine dehydrogenase PreA subunit